MLDMYEKDYVKDVKHGSQQDKEAKLSNLEDKLKKEDEKRRSKHL
jgi:hypothetical protein